jgi:hypothetical protein
MASKGAFPSLILILLSSYFQRAAKNPLPRLIVKAENL